MSKYCMAGGSWSSVKEDDDDVLLLLLLETECILPGTSTGTSHTSALCFGERQSRKQFFTAAVVADAACVGWGEDEADNDDDREDGEAST